jgi:hypothetical protein
MAWSSLTQRMSSASFPLVLAGPMLRHVGHESVTVFVALRESRQVTLRVYTGTGGSRTQVCEGTAPTVALGTRLHVVAVTAPTAPGTRLVPETAYFYDLDFGATQNTLGATGVLDTSATDAPLAYPGAKLPSFAYPPANLTQVRLVHASCRKPHGPSLDALPGVDEMIFSAAGRRDHQPGDVSTPAAARDRPHQLLLTGDQIYADDVADALLFMLMDAADALLGWTEALPGGPEAAALAPGARGTLTLDAGLTSGYPNKAFSKSHLVRFGEFCAMYLFAWSPTLWPTEADLPTASTVFGTAAAPGYFANELKRLTQFNTSLSTVRKVLANVPTYMVFDDHEVTDDWLMNRRWCAAPNRKLEPTGGALAPATTSPEEWSGLGRRIMQNALAAYAVFQAWGSTPERFGAGADGNAGRTLLAALRQWNGVDEAARATIEQRVGVPGVLPTSDVTLTKPDGALRWSYRIAPLDTGYEILVLDCRTERDYPPSKDDLLPPGLLSADAIKAQITDVPTDARKVTLVVSQTPVLAVQEILEVQALLTGTLLWGFDVEPWGLNKTAYQRVLAALAQRRERVVVLSGDVHYSFAARMSFRATRPFGERTALPSPRAAVIGQLTSSSLHNEGDTFFSSRRFHEGGYTLPATLRNVATQLRNIGGRVHRMGWNDASTAKLTLGPGRVFSLRFSQPVTWDPSPLVADPGTFPAGSTPFSPPEWEYRILYLRGRKPPSTTPTVPRLETMPADSTAAARETTAMHTAFRNQLGNDVGRDIVARPNVGEVRFGLDSAGMAVWAEQHTWWRFEETATMVPITTFTVQLTPDLP